MIELAIYIIENNIEIIFLYIDIFNTIFIKISNRFLEKRGVRPITNNCIKMYRLPILKASLKSRLQRVDNTSLPINQNY